MIQLRDLLMRDAKLLVEYLNNREVLEYLERIRYPYKLSHAIEFIRKSSSSSDIIKGITYNDVFVGVISIEEIFRGRGKLEYWLARDYWGRGIMSEAVRKVIEIAKERGLDLIYTFVATPNIGSQRVLEKNDFKRAGIIKDYIRNVFGEKFDAYIYFRKI